MTDQRIRLVPASEFLTHNAEAERGWLIERLLAPGSITLWTGRPKVGKSHTLLQLAYDLACGQPVFGHFPVARALRVAYLELEEPESITQGRLGAMLAADGRDASELGNLTLLGRSGLRCAGIATHHLLMRHQTQLCEGVREAGAELVVILALRKIFPVRLRNGYYDSNMNDPDMAEACNVALGRLRDETGAALAVGHHTRKTPAETAEAQGLGSTMLSAEADAVFHIGRSNLDRSVRRVEVEGRYSEVEEFLLRLDGQGQRIVWVADASGKQEKVEAIRQRTVRGETLRQAAQAEGVAYSTAQRWMAEE